ncbi:MAG: inositol monophosphatase family protein [Brevinema sp.]
MNTQDFLKVALECESKISNIFKEGFYQKQDITWKSEKDPVTIYDQEIEKITREIISSYYPDHAILGEEEGLSSNISDYKWIIDPIDGTINFTRKLPFVSFSLALSYKDDIIVALVSNPILGEVFHAIKGEGAFLNGQKITVSKERKTSQSFLCLGTYKPQFVDIYHTLIEEFQSVRNLGSAALALAYVADGRIDGAIYFKISAWDIAAGVLILKEAGGIVNNTFS